MVAEGLASAGPSSLVEIGMIARPHGVRGELRVRLHNADSTALDVVDEILVDGQLLTIAGARRVRGGALVRLVGIDDRNAAERLSGKRVQVPRDQLELEDDDLLLSDFLGCALKLQDGSDWGTIVDVIAGSQDLLVIHDMVLEKAVERYLPLVDAFLVDVDLESKIVVVAPPEELPEWER